MQLPVEIHQDEAGNLWATLKGKSDKTLLIGGHMDSVPNGGWLDGCLNVLAGVEVLRRIASEGTPPVTIRLVDWCDEEGRDSDEACSVPAELRARWWRMKCGIWSIGMGSSLSMP